MEAGAHLCLAISLRQLTPFTNAGNTMEPYFLQGGRGRILIVTSVTTPRVPRVTKQNRLTDILNYWYIQSYWYTYIKPYI